MKPEAIAQLIGLVGLVLSLLSFQQKKRKNIMLCQMTASLAFCTQLFMLGAITGGCVDLISTVRTAIFANNGKKWATSRLWLYLFILLMIGAGILTWENAWSLLPILGAVLSTVALWMKEERYIRLISLFVGPCWLIYNLVNGAYTGALNELLAMTSIVIGMIRHDRKKSEDA